MRQLIAWRAVALVALAACASPGTPPGGPPDTTPPKVVQVVPESGSVNASPSAVVFRFDEVISERPVGASRLDDMFLVSPRGRGVDVTWSRDEIWIRAIGGWKKNAVYTITMLPGIADLRNNVLKRGQTLVFATGPTIANTRIAGMLFDWVKGTASPNSLIEAIARVDTTLAYVALTDSSGRFRIDHVPPGDYLMRGAVPSGAIQSRTFDRRRAFDTVAVSLRDSVSVELLAFVHDTLGPRIATLTVRDSVTLRVTLDQPVAAGLPITRAMFTLRTKDSTEVPIDSVFSADAFAKWETAQRDSVVRRDSVERARADTTKRPPPRARADTLQRAPPLTDAERADSTRADSVKKAAPKPSKASPINEVVIRLVTPLPAQSAFRLHVRDIRGLLGRARPSDRAFVTPKAPVAKDSTAAPGAPRPPAAAPRDSSGAARPTATPPQPRPPR